MRALLQIIVWFPTVVLWILFVLFFKLHTQIGYFNSEWRFWKVRTQCVRY